MPQKWNYYEDKQFFLFDYFSHNARKSTERDNVYEHLYIYKKFWTLSYCIAEHNS